MSTFHEGQNVRLKPEAAPPGHDWHDLVGHNKVGKVKTVLTWSVYKQNRLKPANYEILIGTRPNGFIEVVFELGQNRRRIITAPATDFELAK